ncbi:MAG: hypothetical protein ACJ8H8_09470, partial [Geminicoccaceae bacterium]
VAEPLLFYAFDLLQPDGQDLRDLPLLERKGQLELLRALLPLDCPIRFSEHLTGRGPDMHRHAWCSGVEGIIAKRVDAPYRSGRHGDWLKVKCYAPQEFVMGGYTTVKNRGLGLGSLLLGDQRHGALAYVGRVGTGWDRRTAEKVHNALCPLQQARSPFVRMPVAVRHWARWARPRLVAEVRCRPGADMACCGTPASADWVRIGRQPPSSGRRTRSLEASRQLQRRRPWTTRADDGLRLDSARGHGPRPCAGARYGLAAVEAVPRSRAKRQTTMTATTETPPATCLLLASCGKMPKILPSARRHGHRRDNP